MFDIGIAGRAHEFGAAAEQGAGTHARPARPLKLPNESADTDDVGQILSDLYYFARRVQEEMARARRSQTRFSIAVFTACPRPDELPEIACVRSLPAILTGVRETDSVCRIDRDTIAVLLIDANGEGSRTASLRLLERLGDDVACWRVRVLEYPEHDSVLVDLGLVA